MSKINDSIREKIREDYLKRETGSERPLYRVHEIAKAYGITQRMVGRIVGDMPERTMHAGNTPHPLSKKGRSRVTLKPKKSGLSALLDKANQALDKHTWEQGPVTEAFEIFLHALRRVYPDARTAVIDIKTGDITVEVTTQIKWRIKE